MRKWLPKIKKILFWIVVILFGGFLLFYVIKLIEPASAPQNIFITNATDHQATISWTTKKPTRGTILVSPDNRFPLLPVFTKVFKDDGEKGISKTGFYLTHKTTITGLAPQKVYYYRIFEGWKRVHDGVFTTGPALKSLSSPNPVYGRVINEKKASVIGALVYLKAVNGATSSAYLSTLTNKEGRWSLDLGNLRGKSSFNQNRC